MNNVDDKWTDALALYISGGIVPYFKLDDGSVDAAKTIAAFCEMYGIEEVEQSREGR